VHYGSEWLWIVVTPHVYRAGRIRRRRLVMRHAARDDVRVGAAVAIAVERLIVDDHGVIDARDDVGAGGIVEQAPNGKC